MVKDLIVQGQCHFPCSGRINKYTRFFGIYNHFRFGMIIPGFLKIFAIELGFLVIRSKRIPYSLPKMESSGSKMFKGDSYFLCGTISFLRYDNFSEVLNTVFCQGTSKFFKDDQRNRYSRSSFPRVNL